MSARTCFRSAIRWSAAAIGLAGGAYAAYTGVAWYRYGYVPRPVSSEEQDELLDRFMPECEVRERHRVRVAAPADITLAAARDMELSQLAIVRAIIKAREIVLGATPDDRARPQGLLAEMQALGWGVLAERPGREIVVGAVTQPWEGHVVFRALPPGEFAAFHEPGYVKIAWTLRADPAGDDASIFSTETRAIATDPDSRARFRRYYSWASPGMALIRLSSLWPLKKTAERRARGSEGVS